MLRKKLLALNVYMKKRAKSKNCDLICLKQEKRTNKPKVSRSKEIIKDQKSTKQKTDSQRKIVKPNDCSLKMIF